MRPCPSCGQRHLGLCLDYDDEFPSVWIAYETDELRPVEHVHSGITDLDELRWYEENSRELP